MLWLLAAVVVVGLGAGTTFRVPILIAASALVVIAGLFTSLSWVACLIGLVALEISYFAALFASTAWSRGARLKRRD